MKALFAAVCFTLNTIFWCLLMYPFALMKVLIPISNFGRWCTRTMVGIGENWISGNGLIMATLENIEWDIEGLEGLRADRSYLVSSNHQSWVDIVVLQKVFNRRIPFLRFFLKSNLIYVPFLGLAWWALDFPFMKRHSRSYLEKHPEKRGEDLATTRRACERFRGTRISILNFLEGTRWTKEKHARSKSPFPNLLPPKAGGLAFVLDAMGTQFDSFVDVTVSYPGGPISLWGLFAGKLSRVVIRIRQLPIPKNLLSGNYLQDEEFRQQMQAWVREIWEQKQELLSRLEPVSRPV